MRGDLVALDLETTGLDIHNDHIIEIGAVRFRDGVIIDEFSTVINPNVQIPPQVTYLTGIQQSDVLHAPSIEIALPKLTAFIGSAPVVAHNVAFDMGFLQTRYNILKKQTTIDTYDLASVLLPSAERYNLNSLTQAFKIELTHAHRALDDARAAALLYWALWEKLITYPHHIIEHIVRLSKGVTWSTASVFEAALAYAPQQTSTPTPIKPTSTVTNATSATSQQPITAQQIETYLGANGQFQTQYPNFAYRPQQLEMAQSISDAFNQGENLIIEAGTGTGKSLAYLLPASLWALANNEKVVISTNTINLQDQLLTDTIPLIQSVLGSELRACVMKGRSNYLSPKRLAIALRRHATSVVEARTLAKILIWQLESNTGDKTTLSLRGAGEHAVWAMVNADEVNDCEAEDFDTPFCQARHQAENSHIIIINHALLLADAKSNHSVLPPYRLLIVDEAHQLEDAITHSMSQRLDEDSLIQISGFLGNTAQGLLGDLLSYIRKQELLKEAMKLEGFITSIDDVVREMHRQIKAMFKELSTFINKERHKQSDFMTLVRLNREHRQKDTFIEAQLIWRNLIEYFDVLIDALQRLTKFLNRINHIPNIPTYLNDINNNIDKLTQAKALFNGFLLKPSDNEIYWISHQQGSESPSVHLAPLHIGHLMEDFIWNKKHSTILTSATLQTHEGFTFIQHRLNADHIKTLTVGSPFDYPRSTMIYIPQDVPEPVDRKGYQHALERGIIELAAALQGRVMVLFTSYSQLKQTAQVIIPRLALGNITVYDQTDGTSRQTLLENFKLDERAVLLGTKSFWEGVDIPGDSLSALVITRLPFTVPTDPIFSSRAETYRDSFADYNLPDAILTFRQGFGRLIRTETDRGIVVIMDSRIHTKSYGSSFIDALPECTIRRGNLDDLPSIAQDWLKS
jgi:ATP-dependent DNA helicase DinG